MERFVVEGGQRLEGTITPTGNKNAALPLLAATLLTDAEVVLRNVPEIGDVATMLALVERLGASVERRGHGAYAIRAAQLNGREPDAALARKIRPSVLLAGPLLARRGFATLPRPGGDAIGRRRLDTHFLALRALGAAIEVLPGQYVMRADSLQGADIFLDEMSVTGTEQAVLAAVRAEGHTTIGNAASEPHVQDLCRCLNAMGARISGIGTNVLEIDGVASLGGTDFTIGPDFMEVGSLISLAAVTRSALRIAGARPRDHRMTKIVFERLGVTWRDEGDDIVVPADQELCVQDDAHGAIPNIHSMPWPGFNPDLISPLIVVATQARGTMLFRENMFESRLFWLDRLIAMGARVVLCDPHRAVVVGPSQLYGEDLVSPDIRAGMALVIAALCAEGRSTIHNISQIDRGYERIDERLRALGARIKRVR
jgi:UDP-N-acetylglucosamine 1-carboxyvinyltransferase